MPPNFDGNDDNAMWQESSENLDWIDSDFRILWMSSSIKLTKAIWLCLEFLSANCPRLLSFLCDVCSICDKIRLKKKMCFFLFRQQLHTFFFRCCCSSLASVLLNFTFYYKFFSFLLFDFLSFHVVYTLIWYGSFYLICVHLFRRKPTDRRIGSINEESDTVSTHIGTSVCGHTEEIHRRMKQQQTITIIINFVEFFVDVFTRLSLSLALLLSFFSLSFLHCTCVCLFTVCYLFACSAIVILFIHIFLLPPLYNINLISSKKMKKKKKK